MFATIAMQILTTILAFAALASAVVLPRGESFTLNFDGHQLDAAQGLGVLGDLLSTAGLSLKRDEGALFKRKMVPGLHCGYTRAARCAGATSGVLATCIIAAVEKGKDIKQDAGCAASLVAFGSVMPTDCKLCLGITIR